MSSESTAISRGAGPAGDRGVRAADVGAIRAELKALASHLETLWFSALEGGDFEEITRLLEASHAVHRAAVALAADRVGPASRDPASPP
jgi:hypothetical protein